MSHDLIPFSAIAPIMFGFLIVFVLTGFPVGLGLIGYGFAFTLLGIALGYYNPAFVFALPLRVYGLLYNDLLLAIPFFTLMGLVLERSGIAEELLESVGELLGATRGGLAITVIAVGTLLAATTGIVQASVTAMGLISLPTMLRQGYHPALSSGLIAASGTLAQIIPPSLVLIVIADGSGVPIYSLYERALGAGLVLAGAYFVYVFVHAKLWPQTVPMPLATVPPHAWRRTLKSALPPVLIIVTTLGSVLSGVATPTESGGFGAIASLVLAFSRGKLNIRMLRQALDATALLSCCAIFILIGASFFSLPLRGMDGDVWIAQWFNQLPGGAVSFMLVTNLLIFLLAFFLDFFEIAFIVLPLLMPVVRALDIDPAWFAVLVCLTLQTSFMHPPFGIAICNLRSVAPRAVKTSDIYRGTIPFLILQLGVVALLIVFPEFVISLR